MQDNTNYRIVNTNKGYVVEYISNLLEYGIHSVEWKPYTSIGFIEKMGLRPISGVHYFQSIESAKDTVHHLIDTERRNTERDTKIAEYNFYNIIEEIPIS